jgi:hypothetical protein
VIDYVLVFLLSGIFGLGIRVAGAFRTRRQAQIQDGATA